jgi:hypothetical protein
VWLLVPCAAFAVMTVAAAIASRWWLAPDRRGWRSWLFPLLLVVFLAAVYGNLAYYARALRDRERASWEAAGSQLHALSRGAFRYYEKHQNFPPAAVLDKGGKPLLSWRVAILPLLDQQALYERFKLDEPWDSPHNQTLLAEMPAIYAAPHRPDAAPGTTVYQVFVGPGTLFDPVKPLELPPDDFPGGPRELLLIVEAAQPVPWTKPEDLPYAPDRPLPPLGSVSYHAWPPVVFVPVPRRIMLAVDALGGRHAIDLEGTDEETLRRSIALTGDPE